VADISIRNGEILVDSDNSELKDELTGHFKKFLETHKEIHAPESVDRKDKYGIEHHIYIAKPQTISSPEFLETLAEQILIGKVFAGYEVIGYRLMENDFRVADFGLVDE